MQDKKCEKAFKEAKEKSSYQPILVHYDPSDASVYDVNRQIMWNKLSILM